MSPQRVLLIGDCDHPDFAGLEPWLHERCEVASASGVAEAAPFATAPDLCIFVEARPGLIRQEDVEAVHRAAPLARLAMIAGAWCEGEMRTGAPPAGVVRMYWHEWPARLGSLWDSANETEANAWRLPRTALSGERTLASGVWAVEEGRRLIAVRAESAVSFGSLAAVLQAAGHAAVWIAPSQPLRVRGAAALLWEGDVRHASQVNELARLAESLRPAPTFALLNFPRVSDRRLALDAGATDILAKPFSVADLLQQMRAALDGRA